MEELECEGERVRLGKAEQMRAGERGKESKGGSGE